jgi:hypothetical protein
LQDGDQFLILDSEARRLVRFNNSGITQQTLLSGFPRGIAEIGGTLFVASSAGRVVSRKNPVVPKSRAFWDMAAERVCVHELDKASLAVKAKHFPLIAGFEIYDLLILEGAAAVDPPRERLVTPDIHAMARAYYEATKRAMSHRY